MEYTLRVSKRARNMRITVRKDASIVVTVPQRVHKEVADLFVREKKTWIQKAIEHMNRRQRVNEFTPKGTKEEYYEQKEKARALVHKKLAHFNEFYGYVWNRVAIKNTSSRWGSCSKKRNLNFSYRITHLPEALQDYLIVHELCHLGSFDHSQTFWKLVERSIPDFETKRKALRGLY